MTAKIAQINYEDEMENSFYEYAMAVITDRAIPDVRDGLKPVHRRILYSMLKEKNTADKGYRKSAKTVGTVLGNYHPHGDTAIYDSMVRLAQNFKLRLPLIDGQGNFGSIDGDSAAAMRYTEARLDKTSDWLLEGVDKGLVDMVDNFDGTEKEPVVLPAKFPQLLINGTSGISVGMKSEVPQHNPKAVVDAFLLYLKNENIDIEKLISVIEGPDYPAGAELINKTEMQEFYRTGRGKAILRAKYHIEPGQYGKTNIVITEIPQTSAGSKAKLYNDIIDKCVNKVLNEVSNVSDESNDKIRIVIEVKKGVNIDKFIPKLFSKTDLQKSESYQFLVIADNQPETINLKEYFAYYLKHQREVFTRQYERLLQLALSRLEILDGLLQATNEIDAIVEVVRYADTPKTMKECLMTGETTGISFKLKKNETTAKKFSFTERQAQAILDMRLQKLGSLEKQALLDEKDELESKIEHYKKILASDKELLKVIEKGLKEFSKLVAHMTRKTTLHDVTIKKFVEEVKVEDVFICVDKFNYTKTLDTVSGDLSGECKYVLSTKTDDKLAVFTNEGNLYQLKMKDIPKGKGKDKGKPLQAIANMNRGEYPIFVTTTSELMKENILIVTEKGLVKQVEGKDYETKRQVIAYTKLDAHDKIIVVHNSSKSDVVLASEFGRLLRFKIKDIGMMKKTTKGVKGLSLKEGDKVSSAYVIDSKEDVLIKTNGKETSSTAISIGKRGAVGKQI